MNDAKETQAVETLNTANNEVKKEVKTFTQDEVNAIVSERLKDEKSKSEAAIQDAIKTAIAEYERKAKLSQEEREKEANNQKTLEQKTREDSLTLRENTLEAKDLLSSKGIPKETISAMTKFLVDLDMNKTKENIEDFVKTFNKSIETGVEDKLKGTPPEDYNKTNNDETKKPIQKAF